MEYSVDTLKKHFDLINKRGLITKKMMECIPGHEEYLENLKELREEKKNARANQNHHYIESVNEEINLCKADFDNAVNLYLEDLCHRIMNGFSMEMKSFSMDGKLVYTIEKRLDSLLLMGMLNKDIRSCYWAQPADRMAILRPLKYLLEETHHKIILRVDIKSFYESIPFQKLFEKLQNDGILCVESLCILREIKEKYNICSNGATGIPRGIGCSPFLSEVYIRDIDTRIKELPGVYFYGRYVDDIVLFAAKTDNITAESLYNKVSTIMNDYCLTLHTPEEKQKTKLIDTSISQSFDFDFLGYRISVSHGRVKFLISPAKVDVYKEKIREAVDTYIYQANGKSHRNHKSPSSQLFAKIRLMTSNYKLCGAKNDIMAGIYFKYRDHCITPFFFRAGVSRAQKI